MLIIQRYQIYNAILSIGEEREVIFNATRLIARLNEYEETIERLAEITVANATAQLTAVRVVLYLLRNQTCKWVRRIAHNFMTSTFPMSQFLNLHIFVSSLHTYID